MVAPQKTASLLIIGNEILSGRTQDANTAYIAGRLAELGIVLKEARIVRDVEEEIIAGIHALRAISDYVFTTGGIGPTHDDITASSIAKAFDLPLEKNAQAYQAMCDHYGAEKEVSPARLKMAMLPKGAGLIPNPVSAAPGFVLENVYVLAGVPKIMQAMFDDIAAGLSGGPAIRSRTVVCDFPESVLAQGLAEIQQRFSSVDIGSYPHYRDGRMGASLVMRGTDEAALDHAEQEVEALVARL